MTKDTDGYKVVKILPSHTYGLDKQPRILTSTFYQVLPTGWMDDEGYQRVPGLKNSHLVLPMGTNGWNRITTVQMWRGHFHNYDKNKITQVQATNKNGRCKPKWVNVLHKSPKNQRCVHYCLTNEFMKTKFGSMADEPSAIVGSIVDGATETFGLPVWANRQPRRQCSLPFAWRYG